MCMWFGYNPWINFCHFFHSMNFVIFLPQILWKCRDSGYLVSPTPHTILYQSLWNFARFCHGLAMCIWFGYNPWITFCHFFHFVISWSQILWKCIDSGYLVSATPYTISCLSLCNFVHFFSMFWRCACGLDVILQLIFVTFPLYFSHVRHQLHRSSICVFQPSQSLGGVKTGDPREKPPHQPQAEFVLLTWSQIRSSPQRWNDKWFRVLKISSLNHATMGAAAGVFDTKNTNLYQIMSLFYITIFIALQRCNVYVYFSSFLTNIQGEHLKYR